MGHCVCLTEVYFEIASSECRSTLKGINIPLGTSTPVGVNTPVGTSAFLRRDCLNTALRS